MNVKPFLPPSLIIQDELHLIEGPLGSIVGIYEIATDILSCSAKHKPKYIASSATVKEAESQVGAVFRRKVSIFPPQGISLSDNYFSENREDRKSTSEKAGRLYLGVSAPNKILTVPVRIWATLLGEIYKMRTNPEKYFLDKKFNEPGEKEANETFSDYVQRITDPFWTLIGYFNAIKELQIARSLYGDDIARDVRVSSCDQFTSIENRMQSVRLNPAIRFIPIKISSDCKINRISIYCQNSHGKISVILYDNTEDEYRPGKILSDVRNDDRVKGCEKGDNDFQLANPVIVKKDDVLWVAVINDNTRTLFQTGISNQKSFSLQISKEEINHAMENCEFPKELSKIVPENTTIHASLSTVSRDIGFEPIELTGQTDSQELPHILRKLNVTPGNKVFVMVQIPNV